MFDETRQIYDHYDISRVTNGRVHTKIWDDVVVEVGCATATSSALIGATGSALISHAKSEGRNRIGDPKRSAQLVQKRFYGHWESLGRFLPEYVRHASLVPALHELASDCFVAVTECKTRGGRWVVSVCYGLKAAFMVADCYRLAFQTRLRNEIVGITSLFPRK